MAWFLPGLGESGVVGDGAGFGAGFGAGLSIWHSGTQEWHSGTMNPLYCIDYSIDYTSSSIVKVHGSWFMAKLGA